MSHGKLLQEAVNGRPETYKPLAEAENKMAKA